MKFTFSADESIVQKAVEDIDERMRAASTGALQDAADEMVRQGRANIASAGFSSRWQRGLDSKFYPNEDFNAASIVFHRIGFAGVFEHGVTIVGKPLLWLPIEQNLPGRVRSPKQYRRPMVSVNVSGKAPLLFDKFDRDRGPLFVGIRSATLSKRFNLYSIFERIVEQMQKFYDQRFKAD